jgi:hypothetical protein
VRVALVRTVAAVVAAAIRAVVGKGGVAVLGDPVAGAGVVAVAEGGGRLVAVLGVQVVPGGRVGWCGVGVQVGLGGGVRVLPGWVADGQRVEDGGSRSSRPRRIRRAKVRTAMALSWWTGVVAGHSRDAEICTPQARYEVLALS